MTSEHSILEQSDKDTHDASDVRDATDYNTDSNDKSIIGRAIDKIKYWFTDKSVIAATIATSIVIILIAIIIYFVIKRKRSNKINNKKEEFSASNDISNEFDYVNSVIYSTLGDVSGLKNIDSKTVTA